MSEKTFCTLKCEGACHHRNGHGKCCYEYSPADCPPSHRWKGEGDPPARWRIPNGTIVYRTFSDFCNMFSDYCDG